MLVICNEYSKECDYVKCPHRKPHEEYEACGNARCSKFRSIVHCIPYDLEYHMRRIIKKHEENKDES
jgi:hypothetical protein